MGRLVFGMMQSLDGYVDGVSDGLELPPPGARPPLRLIATDPVGEETVRLTYVAA